VEDERDLVACPFAGQGKHAGDLGRRQIQTLSKEEQWDRPGPGSRGSPRPCGTEAGRRRS
jgi:hypothetical protein